MIPLTYLTLVRLKVFIELLTHITISCMWRFEIWKKHADIMEKYVASFFMIEEQAKQAYNK
jgi:hypothetical protein